MSRLTCPPGTVVNRTRTYPDPDAQACIAQALTDGVDEAGQPPNICGSTSWDEQDAEEFRAEEEERVRRFLAAFNAAIAGCGLSDSAIKGILQAVSAEGSMETTCPDERMPRGPETFTFWSTSAPTSYEEESCVGVGRGRVFPGPRPPEGWGWHGGGHHRPSGPGPSPDPFVPNLSSDTR